MWAKLSPANALEENSYGRACVILFEHTSQQRSAPPARYQSQIFLFCAVCPSFVFCPLTARYLVEAFPRQ
jgi:hypothetical protein